MPKPLISITRKQALIFSGFLVLYEFLTYFANDMIMPAMVNVIHDFSAPTTAIASSLTLYILGGASLQILLGPLSDCYGRRIVMIWGTVLFFIFSVLIALSQSIEQFLLFRFFQGMGLCFISVIGYATIQEIFEEMDAVRLIAFMANITIIAPLIGPLVGTLAIHWMSWPSIFIAIALFSIFSIYGIYRYMPETIGQKMRNGVTIQRVPFSFKLICQNYMALLKNQVVLLGAINLGLLGIACVGWIGIAPLLIIIDGQETPLTYALIQIPIFGACILGNTLLQKATHHFSLLKLVTLGSLLVTISLALTFTLPFIYSDSYYTLLPGLILYFFSLGFATAPMERFILFATPVGKGTTSALKSLISMVMIGAGVEATNRIYPLFGLKGLASFFGLTGILYSLLTLWIYKKTQALNTPESLQCENPESR